jgi:hypothetical protein
MDKGLLGKEKTRDFSPWRFCVAPIMDWTHASELSLYKNALCARAPLMS